MTLLSRGRLTAGFAVCKPPLMSNVRPLTTPPRMSADIVFSQLFTYAVDDTSVRLPLDALARSSGHIHGVLKLEVAGRVLPHMGFFGPDDVCFNTWVEELSQLVLKLGAGEAATYTFDEGEQGQPAFVFRRDGDLLYVSVVDSQLSGAKGDLSYQSVGCQWSEFRAAVSSFLASFRAALLEQCPRVGQTWWASHAQPAP